MRVPDDVTRLWSVMTTGGLSAVHPRLPDVSDRVAPGCITIVITWVDRRTANS